MWIKIDRGLPRLTSAYYTNSTCTSYSLLSTFRCISCESIFGGTVMGSTGSGRFSDYPGSSKQGGGEDQAGGLPVDRCAKALSTSLEDIEHCEYFKKYGTPPAVSTILHVAHTKRIVAQTASGEVVGNLPTGFNYLAACLKAGYTYVGQVRTSSKGPVASVERDVSQRRRSSPRM